jgi:ribonuclease P protein component
VVERLRKRRDFLAAARGRRCVTSAMVLQARRRAGDEGEGPAPRLGFTVTKKVGTAVVRNRVRRRLKEAARLVADRLARPEHDYVIVGRREALDISFDTLLAELDRAFHVVHAKRREPVQPARRPIHSDAAAPGPDGDDV